MITTFAAYSLFPGALARPDELEAGVEEESLEVLVGSLLVDEERDLQRGARGDVRQWKMRRVIT